MLYCAASGYVALWRGSPGAVPLADSRPHPAGLRSCLGAAPPQCTLLPRTVECQLGRQWDRAPGSAALRVADDRCQCQQRQI